LNKHLLNIEIQNFIKKNLKSDLATLLLKGIAFETASTHDIIEQIEAKKRSEKKLPTWFNAQNIYYPNKINIEQTSSEATAVYKTSLVSGKTLIDLTGGFGIDTYYFSKQITNVTHCEINSELSEIVKHNYEVLNVPNINCLNESGIDALKRIKQQFNWIYVDPSRRDDTKQKVFLLLDCTPDIKTFQGLFLKYAKNVMVKTSPLLDIKATLSDIKHVKEIHVVALHNEVKELLWILERNYEGKATVKTVNLQKETQQNFDFKIEEEKESQAEYSLPLTYLYEPNSAILKAGAFNSISYNLNITKLHKHSHLYTSETLIEFPGRHFKIKKVIPFNKKAFVKEHITKANVTTRNFTLSVGEIRKKFKIKDGGLIYLFFTTNFYGDKTILVCSKID